jgi:hypothetical protein
MPNLWFTKNKGKMRPTELNRKLKNDQTPIYFPTEVYRYLWIVRMRASKRHTQWNLYVMKQASAWLFTVLLIDICELPEREQWQDILYEIWMWWSKIAPGCLQCY